MDRSPAEVIFHPPYFVYCWRAIVNQFFTAVSMWRPAGIRLTEETTGDTTTLEDYSVLAKLRQQRKVK
jgi:hypothetical protein